MCNACDIFDRVRVLEIFDLRVRVRDDMMTSSGDWNSGEAKMTMTSYSPTHGAAVQNTKAHHPSSHTVHVV